MKYDKYVLTQLNKRMILDLIRKKGPINKAEIAKLLGLSIPTVMKITEEFLNNKIVSITGKGVSTGGKKPELLEFVSNSYYIVGIDIGRHSVKIILMDMSAQIVVKKTLRTFNIDPIEPFFAKIIDVVKEIIEEEVSDKEKILGIGIGMPGIIDKEKGEILFSPDFNIFNVPILDFFKERLDYRIELENSNRAMGMGEYWFGAGITSKVGLYINLGYGIGSCLIEGGELYYGSSGTSGELGHMTLEKDGELCECGNRGCLEALASGNSIAREAKKRYNLIKNNGITSLCNGEISKIEAEDVFDAAAHGDEIAVTIIENALNYIGIGIAGCINLLDPDIVVLAGGLMKSPLSLPRIERTIKNHQMLKAGRNARICIGKLGEDATAVGAATLILKLFIDNGGSLS